MDMQTTKQKIIYEQKQEMDQKRKNFSKRPSNKSLKEKIDENNEVIIIKDNVQDLEKDIKTYVDKLEKQIIINNSVLSIQRNHFKEIISKLSIYLDQEGISFEEMKNKFRSLDFTSILNPNLLKLKRNYSLNQLNDFFKKIEEKQNNTTENNTNQFAETNAVLIESDNSIKNEMNLVEEKKSVGKRKRVSLNEPDNIQKKRKKRKIEENEGFITKNNDNNDGLYDLDQELLQNNIKNFVPNFVNNNKDLLIQEPINNKYGNYFNGFINNNNIGYEKGFNVQEQQNLFILAQNLMQKNGENIFNGFNEMIQSNKQNNLK